MTLGIRLLWSYPVTHETHTCGRAFSSGSITTYQSPVFTTYVSRGWDSNTHFPITWRTLYPIVPPLRHRWTFLIYVSIFDICVSFQIYSLRRQSSSSSVCICHFGCTKSERKVWAAGLGQVLLLKPGAQSHPFSQIAWSDWLTELIDMDLSICIQKKKKTINVVLAIIQTSK